MNDRDYQRLTRLLKLIRPILHDLVLLITLLLHLLR
jgi:hypothetical protein